MIGDDDLIVDQGALGDRRLLDASVGMGEDLGLDPVATRRDDEAASRVVEEEDGALERGQPADRLADPVVKRGRVGGCVAELEQQPDDEVERVAAQRLGIGGHPHP